jgi:hypothetical protein
MGIGCIIRSGDPQIARQTIPLNVIEHVHLGDGSFSSYLWIPLPVICFLPTRFAESLVIEYDRDYK